MKKILMYDKYDETYREVIDVKELKEYILKRIEEIENTGIDIAWEQINYTIREQDRAKIQVLQSFLKDLEVEDD